MAFCRVPYRDRTSERSKMVFLTASGGGEGGMDPNGDPVRDDAGEERMPSERVEEPDVVVPTETVYLDLDGDGVPDAVRTTSTIGFDVSGDGVVDVVEVTEELASGIGVDGTAAAIRLTDTFEADFEHDGTVEQFESVTIDIESDAARD